MSTIDELCSDSSRVSHIKKSDKLEAKINKTPHHWPPKAIVFFKGSNDSKPSNPSTHVMSNANREYSYVFDSHWSFNKNVNRKDVTVYFIPPNFPPSEIEVHALANYGWNPNKTKRRKIEKSMIEKSHG